MKKSLAVAACCLSAALPLSAQVCGGQSPPHRVALLELYTSEGCSSCPPADRAVGNLKQAAAAGLVVPLALHVGYWDSLGWKDAFAKPEFDRRQRWLAGLTGSSLIYTPEIFLGGRELRDWAGKLPAAIAEFDRGPALADIHMSLGAVAAGKVPLETEIKAQAGSQLYLALYETDVIDRVTAGENGGATLHHDYVVRDWQGPIPLGVHASPQKVQLTRTLSLPSSVSRKNTGVAAFVQAAGGEVLQALAVPLCGE